MQMTPFLHVAASSSLLNQLQSLDHSLEDAVVSLRTLLLSLLTPTVEETPKPAPLLNTSPRIRANGAGVRGVAGVGDAASWRRR